MFQNPLLRWLLDPETPGLGIDIRAGELSLVRLTDRGGKPELSACVTTPLPDACLAFELQEQNIVDRDVLTQTVRDLLARADATGARRIALCLPDYLSRVSVIELPDAPRTKAETNEVLKFSLKRSLPFDANDARLAFERLPAKKPTYLTGVMHESVVSGYEDFFEELGLHVGLILPASVSMLRMLSPVASKYLAPDADYFFVNLERDYFTVCLVRHRDTPVILRTLGMRGPEDGTTAYSREDLVQEIIPTAIYYREKLGGTTLSRVFYRSLRPDLGNISELLEEQFETPSEPFELARAVAAAKDLQVDPVLASSVSAAAGAAAGRVA